MSIPSDLYQVRDFIVGRSWFMHLYHLHLYQCSETLEFFKMLRESVTCAGHP
ncbi:hypothetical protein CROQUDRAFT_650359 [Cronartium quercuum f. sp. fusiforme G11]|uniref:Uncharacterized protein n=1 Tax=Cronartium quercuum f. sp. fusiforme G11 TaxID=708437 RepID=A0A9P6TGY9_9BASI|nr:hypothetical protein CROQUDRAFT_650359 [Cronartium quercuum f. sp. fusiforme G11]